MIPVCWHAMEEGRGYFDCTAFLNSMFDLYECAHYGAWYSMPEDIEGAVVVVHGGREHGRIDKLNEDIAKLKWCLIVAIGDEESTFPLEKIEHANKKIWVQEPIPGRHDFADRFLIDGYGHDHARHIVE